MDKMTENTNLPGMNIRKMRQKHHMTQQDLADCLMIDRTTVSRWESGNSMPDLLHLKNLAECFHISIDQLLGDEKPVPAARSVNFEYENVLIAGMCTASFFLGWLGILSSLILFFEIHKRKQSGYLYLLAGTVFLNSIVTCLND